MSDFIHKLFTSYKARTDGNTRVGELYRIWYDSITNTLRIQLDDTPGGTIIGGGGAGGNYTLPVATSTVLGGVKIGANISINAGVISVAAPFSGSYTDLTNKPTIPAAQVNSDWTASSGVAQILNKPALFSGSYTDLTNKPTIPAEQIQSDWTQSNNASLDYIKNKPTIPDITNIEDALAATGEPMGHKDRSQSVISFDDTSRTFSISPVSGSFEIWTKGVKRTITDTRTVTIPDTTGLYYIYFDTTGTLQQKTTFFDWPNDCITAYVYWNELTNDAPFVADERHGITLDWQTHEYLHRTRGAAIANGFGATNYIVGADGSSDTHMQLDIASGTFFDEDLQVDIVNTNTPVANTWDQDLAGPAKIPMFYINSGGGWVIDEPTNFPIKQGTLPKYNLYSGGVWTTPDIDNNKFGVTFIIATNNINYPVIGIIGQAQRANIGDAEATEFSDLNLAGFPVVEMRPLYKLVYECKNSYTNSVNARLMSVWDQRNFSSIGSAIATYTDHGTLGGLGDDDHPQYLLRTDAPTLATVATSGSYADLTNKPTIPTTVTVNGTAITLGSSGTVTSAAGTLTGTSLNSSVVTSSLTSVGTLTSLTVNSTSSTAVSITADGRPGSETNNWSFVSNQSIGGPRAWIQFPDSTLQTTAYTGTVPAGTLTGTTLNSTVVTSSLTSVGTLTSLTSSGLVRFNSDGVGASYNAVSNSVNIGGVLGVASNIYTNGNIDIVAGSAYYIGGNNVLNGTTLGSNIVNSSLTSVGTLTSLTSTGSVTANHTTAFIAGDNAISNVALQIPREGAIRNLYNGAANNMYFDVSIGGASQGQFQFRSSSAFTNVLTMSPTAFTVNTDAVVTARTASFGRTAWNAAIDTELTIDEYRFRVTNSGGIYPQVISNVSGQTKNSAWTAVAAISGQAIGQGGSTGTLVPNNAWTNLYTFAAMNAAGDTVTVTLQDKAQGRIYRVTFMRSDNGTTTGYNIIAERLL